MYVFDEQIFPATTVICYNFDIGRIIIVMFVSTHYKNPTQRVEKKQPKKTKQIKQTNKKLLQYIPVLE
jgi:hypothetical protein